MFLKYPLLVCSFFLLGNAKADMVGIRPTSTPNEISAVGQNFTFSTTGLSGSKISGIGLYRIGGTESKSLTVSLAGNNSFETKTGSFSVAASSGGIENRITWDGGAFGLSASTDYSLTVGFADSSLVVGDFSAAWGRGSLCGRIRYRKLLGFSRYASHNQYGHLALV